jgi:hypothetical protein
VVSTVSGQELGNHLVQGVSTVGSESLSHKSLMNNYSQPTPEAYEFVFELGQKILVYVLKQMPPGKISKKSFEKEFVQVMSKYFNTPD